jgi:hypothetical protein
MIGNPEGKKQPGMPRHRWEDNIKIDYKVIRCDNVDWIQVVQNKVKFWALVDTLMELRIT